MFKKSVCLFLVLLIAAAVMPIMAVTAATASDTHSVVPGWYVYEDINFNDAVALHGQSVHNQLGWTEQNPTYTAVDTVFAADPIDSSNTVLKISHNANPNGAYENAEYTLETAQTGKTYIETRIYSEGGAWANITLYDQSGNKTIELFNFNPTSENSWRYYNSAGSVIWIATLTSAKSNWFTLGFMLDLDSKTFDLYENGVKRNTTALPLLSDNVAKLSFNRYRYDDAITDSVYFDDIRVYTPEAPAGVDHNVVPGWYMREELGFETGTTDTAITTLTGWERVESDFASYQNFAIATDPASTDNKVAKLTRTDYRGYASPALYKLGRTLTDEKAYVELRVYLDPTADKRPALTLYDSSKTEILYMYPWADGLRGSKYRDATASNNGAVKWFSNDIDNDAVSAGWYTMGFMLDLATQTATFYLNGQKGADISAGLNGTTVAYVGINGDPWKNDNVEYFDDIRVYTPEAPAGVDHNVVPGWYVYEDINFNDAVALRGQSVHNQLGWTEQNPTYTAVDTVFAADPTDSSNTVLKISHNANPNGAYENAEYTLETAQTGKTYIETRIYSEGGAWANITLYDQSGNKTIELFNFNPTSENSWRYYNSAGSVIWIATLTSAKSNWFTLGFMLDLDSKTFDLYENGVKRNTTALPLLSDNVAKLSFNRYRYDDAITDSVYFDDIRVYKETAPAPFTVLDVVMTNQNGEFVNQPAHGGKITAVKVMKRNVSDSAVVYVAAYQAGKLIQADTAAITANSEAGTQQIFPVDITLPVNEAGAYSVKVFVWNNTTDLQPLITPYEVTAKTITLFVAGDSIAQTYNFVSSYPMAGYGQMLQGYMDDTGVTVENRGISGCSTKSYMANGALDSILRNGRSGDYMLIQFGHNDQDVSDPLRGTTIAEYEANLITYIDEAKARGINPILVVPPVRRLLNGTVLYQNILGEYPATMKAVGAAKGVPYIDLYAQTETLVNQMEATQAGSSAKLYMILDAADSDFFAANAKWSGSVFYTQSANDTTHFNKYGANVLAQMISQGLAALTGYEISQYATPTETDPEVAYSAE